MSILPVLASLAEWKGQGHPLVPRAKAPYLWGQQAHESATLTAPTDAQIAVIAETYRLLGDPTRLRVLLACLADPIAVGDIARAVNASPSLVSHHLRLLRAARLVRGTRRNKQVFYEAADEHIARMLADMIEHAMEEHGEDSDT
jgi:DNA-binding transcriptional ArsR family regulator